MLQDQHHSQNGNEGCQHGHERVEGRGGGTVEGETRGRDSDDIFFFKFQKFLDWKEQIN